MNYTDQKRPELLSPAGNFEKLKAALLYGADAVYLAGQRFGMRSAADNFTTEELAEAVAYTHARGKKIYLTLNTMPRADEYPDLRAFLHAIASLGIDAVIVADLGVLATVKEILPQMELHVSTQASIVSPAAAKAYAALGAKRLVLARELNLEEIRAIRDALPPDIELEAFIHGSMCVSYSGRCMLSHHLTGRDANRGACTQPCRWNYTVTEEKRPDMPLPIEENEQGTFIMSSKDMCTLPIVPRLLASGIDSWKIEGRMKSAYYTAVVTGAYRMAIDCCLSGSDYEALLPDLLTEVDSVSHREYCTGYYLDDPRGTAHLATFTGYIREKAYFATALEPDRLPLPDGLAITNHRGTLYPFIQRNKVSVGDAAELISPHRIGLPFEITELYDAEGTPLLAAPHPSMKFFARVPFAVHPGDIMRAGNTD